eukprot:gnl/Dysnectes_brevis/3361_a4229_735.p1 GENE.gnl/Dysnectes_brevis/3361_a4229_735~~gnl/Dysnectes_brevis/3361_a4229_735.p1  ORF type:complete len:884 (+),score=329.61 gnl/Dysnectes_brevis/3361_a4229_735:149-2800(+)
MAQKWQPDAEKLAYIQNMLAEAMKSDSTVQQRVTQQFNSFISEYPDAILYLTYTLLDDTSPPQLRTMAGAVLTGQVRHAFPQLDHQSKAYMQSTLPTALGHPQPVVRKMATNTIAAMSAHIDLGVWEELSTVIGQAVMGQLPQAEKGVFACLVQLAEDQGAALSHSPLAEPLIPPLLAQVQPQAPFRTEALSVFREMAKHMPHPLSARLQDLLQAVFTTAATSDLAEEVPAASVALYRLICCLLYERPGALEANMDNVVELMLSRTEQAVSDSRVLGIVSREIMEFWVAFTDEQKLPHRFLPPHLPRIFSLLEKGTAFDEIERDLLEEADRAAGEGGGVSRGVSSSGQRELEEAQGRWTLRKVSLLVTENLSVEFPDQLSSHLLATGAARLDASRPWWEREAYLSQMGALGPSALSNAPPAQRASIVRMLLDIAKDATVPSPLRAVSVWSLSRLHPLVIELGQGAVEETIHAYVSCMRSRSAREAKYGCTSVAFLIADAPQVLPTFTGNLIELVRELFESYAPSNMVNLYDILQTLSQTPASPVRSDPAIQSSLASILAQQLPVLMAQMEEPDSRTLLVHCTETLQILLQNAVQVAPTTRQLARQAEEALFAAFYRAMGIIHSLPDQPHLWPDLEVHEVQINCLSEIYRALGTEEATALLVPKRDQLIGSIIVALNTVQPNLLDFTFGLSGELCQLIPPLADVLGPQLIDPIYAALHLLHLPNVINNALWLFGVLISRGSSATGDNVNFEMVVRQIKDLLEDQFTDSLLRTNAAITLSKIGLVNPAIASEVFLEVAHSVCAELSALEPGEPDRRTAFMGLSSVVYSCGPSLEPMLPCILAAVASWEPQNTDPELVAAMRRCLEPFGDLRRFSRHYDRVMMLLS